VNERVKKLRQDSLEAVPHISMERARLETEVYKQYGDSLPIPVLRPQADS
jgi:hypothetical protein